MKQWQWTAFLSKFDDFVMVELKRQHGTKLLQIVSQNDLIEYFIFDAAHNLLETGTAETIEQAMLLAITAADNLLERPII